VPIIVLAGDDSVFEGATYALMLGAVADAGADTVVEWIVRWGDGTTSTHDAGGEVTHVYANGEAPRTIVVALVDEDGTHDGAGALSLTVFDVAPTIALAGAATVDEGAAYTLTLGAVTDPGTDTVVEWIVDWGDGTTDTYGAGGE